jgi:hypothetical protein
MAAPTHQILTVPRRPEFAKLLASDRAVKPWFIGQGKPYAALVPKAGLTCGMDLNHKGQKLDDFVYNAMRWLIGSEKVRTVIAAEPGVEAVPLRIVDRKKKSVKARYFMVHPTGPEDCVDLQRSEITWSAMEPETAHTITRLVLDPKRVPSSRSIFRIKEFPRAIIVRSDLVKRLEEAGATGYRLLELDSEILI